MKSATLVPSLKGALWMLAAGISFVVMSTVIRSLSADIHPIEIAFFRALVGLVLMLPYLVRTRGRGLRTES